MRAGSKLRAVSPNEAPPRARPMTVTSAAADGTHRDLLVAMRDRIARTVEDGGCPPRDLAALSRRLMEIAREIEAIDAMGQEGEGAAATPDEPLDTSAV